jgi:hypothetical protein
VRREPGTLLVTLHNAGAPCLQEKEEEGGGVAVEKKQRERGFIDNEQVTAVTKKQVGKYNFSVTCR